MKNHLNPFLYGKPVPASRLIGRVDVARTVYSRLTNGDSTAIVGEPHIGKSSLLKFVASESIRHEWLGKLSDQHLFLDADCQTFPSDFNPIALWRPVTEEIKQRVNDEAIKQQCEIVIQNGFGSFTLESLFRLLAKREWHIVLLLDEFDFLLNHPNFSKAEFFGALRSLATRTDALVVITASRLSIAQMNRKSQEINPYGSPFFNNSIEVRLIPFTRAEAQLLFESSLQIAKIPIKFTAEEIDFIYPLTGGQPFLLQVVGASLFDAISEGKVGDERLQRATKIFNQRADAHFADTWRSLLPDERHAVFLLAIAEYRGYVDGRNFDLGQLAKLERYGPDLRHLRELGVVESDSPTGKGSVAWLGENWKIRVGGFVPWLMDNVVAGMRDTKDFDAVKGMEFLGPLTRDEINKIREIASKIPKGAVNLGVEFIKSLIKK